jgi:hypothetical protein
VITNKRPKSLCICLSLLCLVSFNFSAIQAQDKEPSKLDIATANYKLKDLERRAKLANGGPFSLGKDGQEALQRIATLYKNFPKNEAVLDLFARAKVAVRASKGTFFDITPEMLAYRTSTKKLSDLVEKTSESRWQDLTKDLSNKETSLTQAFPSPDPETVLFEDVENKLVLLEDIEYPGLVFTQGGRQYAFTGTASEGFYYVNCSSREFIGAYEALRRAQQDAGVKLPIQWKILGKVSGVRTLVPRIGANETGNSAHMGWVVTPIAICAPNSVVAEFDATGAKSGRYAGEAQVENALASARQTKKVPINATPAEITTMLVQAAQNRNYELYLDCIDPDLQVTGIQKSYMKFYFDLLVENVFENYVAIDVKTQDEIVLLQGKDEKANVEDLFLDDDLKDKLDETALPKIEQIKIWVQRYSERGTGVGSPAPITLRRYESAKGTVPERWYIFRGWPF